MLATQTLVQVRGTGFGRGATGRCAASRRLQDRYGRICSVDPRLGFWTYPLLLLSHPRSSPLLPLPLPSQSKAKNMRVTVTGKLQPGVTSKVRP